MSMPLDDLTGRVFGELTVLFRHPKDYEYLSGGKIGRKPRWVCRCSCGEETVATGKLLRSGRAERCRDCKYRNAADHLRSGRGFIESRGLQRRRGAVLGVDTPTTRPAQPDRPEY